MTHLCKIITALCLSSLVGCMTVWDHESKQKTRASKSRYFITDAHNVVITKTQPGQECTFIDTLSSKVGKTHPVFWTSNPERRARGWENIIFDAKSVGANYLYVLPKRMPTKGTYRSKTHGHQSNRSTTDHMHVKAYYCPIL